MEWGHRHTEHACLQLNTQRQICAPDLADYFFDSFSRSQWQFLLPAAVQAVSLPDSSNNSSIGWIKFSKLLWNSRFVLHCSQHGNTKMKCCSKKKKKKGQLEPFINFTEITTFGIWDFLLADLNRRNHYLHQGGYVFTSLDLLVGWFVDRITENRDYRDFHGSWVEDGSRPRIDPTSCWCWSRYSDGSRNFYFFSFFNIFIGF